MEWYYGKCSPMDSHHTGYASTAAVFVIDLFHMLDSSPFQGIENNDVLGHLQDGKRLMKPSDCPEDV